MIQLKQKTYTKAELAAVLGINPKDKNYKRTVENTLNSWGYQFEFPPYSKTITIKEIPKGEDKLAEILIRDYGIDIRINAVEFACFLHAFNYIDNFVSMPWGERAKLMYDFYGVSVCDRTLRNWANRLFTTGTLIKSSEKTYWKSAKISDTETLREPIDKYEFMAFYKRRSEEQSAAMAQMIMDGRRDYDEIRKESWATAHFNTMKEFDGWCYFSCKTILLSAFDDKDLAEIFEIVEEIAPTCIKFKQEEDAELAILKQKAAAKIQEEIATVIANGGFIF